MIPFLIFSIISLHFQEPRFAAGQDPCQPARCSPSGPIIRFPFRLKARQPEHCGYPGFDLSCNSNNLTEFTFQFPVQASARNIILPITSTAAVQEIYYSGQVILVTDLNGPCFPARVPEVNSSASPFQMYDLASDGYTLFNCSAKPKSASFSFACMDHGEFGVYAFLSDVPVTDFDLSNCGKMYNISDITQVIRRGQLQHRALALRWPVPVCWGCEEKGMYCRLKNNGTSNETECFEPGLGKKGVSKKVIIAVVVVGVFLIVLFVTALYRIYSLKKRKHKNQKRIQQFLEDYKALRSTRYTYSEIKKITDGFKHKLGQGGYGTVFKGKLSNEIPVAVKVLNTVKGNGEDFINEVKTIGQIHHTNVVRLVGYCADGYRRALVYELLENDSLAKYISSGNQSRTLGWEKLHKIALGIAKGIDYLHQGCNQRILHFDIKPHNILLDHNLNPKVADFGLAKLCSKEQSVVTMTAARGTIGYIAPEVFSRNFGKVSYKSDIYSFGMLLLNMIGGRKNFDAREEDGSSEVYFPEWMYNQLDKGEDIAIQIEKDEDSEIVKRLIIVGLWCIQWYPVDRPSMKVVIQMLEGENMPVMPPNPFAASEPVNMGSSLSFSNSTQTSMSSS